MRNQARINELYNKHRQIEEQIDNHQKRPQQDSLVLGHLKREKLRIKEEITHMEQLEAS